MKDKPLTMKDCSEEIERILRIWLYSKHTQKEEDTFKVLIKNALDRKGQIEHEKYLQKEAERARKEREKYGGNGW